MIRVVVVFGDRNVAIWIAPRGSVSWLLGFVFDETLLSSFNCVLKGSLV